MIKQIDEQSSMLPFILVWCKKICGKALIWERALLIADVVEV